MSTSNISSRTNEISIPESNIVQASYLMAVIVIAIVGNVSIIVAIIRKHLLDNVTNRFILNLCISDLLNASLKMTTSVAGLFVRNWYPSNVICYVTTPLGVLFGAASVFSLTSVAVARYLMIVMPFTYADKATPSVAKFVLGCVWSASIILSFPPITWRPDEIICRSGAVSDSYKTSELVYIIFLWFFVIIFPSAIMLPSYIHIFAVTSYQLRRISLTVPGEQNARKALRRRREVWTAIVLALIGGIFILCWFPFFVILTLHKFASGEVNPMYFKIFLCWMYTNSALNPVILVSFNREIRSAVCRTFASFYGVDSDRSSHSRSYLYSRSCP